MAAHDTTDIHDATMSALLPDAQATERAGRLLAPALAGGMVVTLRGDLGAGKTTFARGLLHALGWEGPVKSPTYTLVEHYQVSSLYLYHFDFYRFVDPNEWDAAGFSDYFRTDAICVIEWPERVATILGTADLEIALAWPPQPAHGRLLHVSAHGAQGKRIAAAWCDAMR